MLSQAFDDGGVEAGRGGQVVQPVAWTIVLAFDLFEVLSQLLVRAAWQAAANSERMRQEASDG